MTVTTRGAKKKREDDQPIHAVAVETTQPSELDVLRLEYQALREQNAWLFRRLEKLEHENGHRRYRYP